MQIDTMRVPGDTNVSACATAAGAAGLISEVSNGGTMTVSAVRNTSGPCSTVIEKSELVRTGWPSAEQVRTS